MRTKQQNKSFSFYVAGELWTATTRHPRQPTFGVEFCGWTTWKTCVVYPTIRRVVLSPDETIPVFEAGPATVRHFCDQLIAEELKGIAASN